jgi:hypothetical protein
MNEVTNARQHNTLLLASPAWCVSGEGGRTQLCGHIVTVATFAKRMGRVWPNVATLPSLPSQATIVSPLLPSDLNLTYLSKLQPE